MECVFVLVDSPCDVCPGRSSENKMRVMLVSLEKVGFWILLDSVGISILSCLIVSLTVLKIVNRSRREFLPIANGIHKYFILPYPFYRSSMQGPDGTTKRSEIEEEAAVVLPVRLSK